MTISAKNGLVQHKDNVTIAKSSGDVGFYAKRTDTDVQVWFGVGSGGANHGVYSNKMSRWLLYGDGTNVYVNGHNINTASEKEVYTLTSKTNGGWSTQADGDSKLITKAFMAWWNGAYASNNSSNLTYAHQGEIQCKPTNLYNNSSGATGTITLSQTAANFNYIEIFYRNNDNRHSSTRIYRPNTGTQNIWLSAGFIYNDIKSVYMKTKEIVINGTSLTVTRGVDLMGSFDYDNIANDVIYITRVDGYK